MWWDENRAVWRRVGRLAAVFAVAVLAAGCFQPLYGQRSPTGGPALSASLSGIDVAQINAPPGSSEARLAVELRNALLFDLTSARPDLENYGLDASYTLTELATGKSVVTGTTFARVSYDIPGQVQRFARIRGLRDAESRAAKVIADNIKTRLASYFVAGT
jgi:LPS-assembly lipoprotein